MRIVIPFVVLPGPRNLVLVRWTLHEVLGIDVLRYYLKALARHGADSACDNGTREVALGGRGGE